MNPTSKRGNNFKKSQERADDEQYLATKGSEAPILVNHSTLESNPKEEKQLQKELAKRDDEQYLAIKESEVTILVSHPIPSKLIMESRRTATSSAKSIKEQ